MSLYALGICILWIPIFFNVIYACPSLCSCDYKHVNCTLSYRTTVPSENELDRLIETLDLSWNNITSLPEQVFWETRIKSLKVIHLNQNKINNISENAFFGQKYLEHVDLSFNNISHISLDLFTWSNNINWLSLAHNPLVIIYTANLTLKSIDLSSCLLTEIPNIEAVDVNLENNKITRVGKVKLDYIKKLEKLKLSLNPFVCDCDLQDFMDLLVTYKIFSSNNCSNSGEVIYNMRSRNCTVCPIGCECHYWGTASCINSNLEEIPGKGFNTSVTTILLSKNKISRVKNYTFLEVNTTNLLYLSLSYNRISVIESVAFSGLSKLKYLDISYNSLTHLHDISFIQMPALSQLSIAKNTLSSVSVANATNVKHLDFSNCGIKNFTEVAKYWGHSLTWLNLKGNKISFLSPEDLKIMKSIDNIDITGNPLECYVNLTDAYSWLNTKQLAKNTTCSLPRDLNGKYWQVLDTYWINDTCTIVRSSKIHSSSMTVTILIFTTCIFLLFSLLLYVYILRKKLRKILCIGNILPHQRNENELPMINV